MEQLSPQDASFIYMENEFNHMSIAILAVFEGPSPAGGEIEALLESRLDLVPRFRQRLRFVPYGLAHPVWCDDPHFSLRYHVRHSALPIPGSAEQVQTVVGRVMSLQLDRSRPLWELWQLDGLQDGNWAVLLKIHHCVADGVAAVELLDTLLDHKPKQSRRKPVKWEPQAQPTPAQLATRAIADSAEIPGRGLRALRSAVLQPRETGSKARQILDGMVSYRRPRRYHWKCHSTGQLVLIAAGAGQAQTWPTSTRYERPGVVPLTMWYWQPVPMVFAPSCCREKRR